MSNRNADANTTRLNFADQLLAFKQFKDSFPRYVGNLAVNFYKDSFRRQGFIDNNVVDKWKARKPSWGKKNNKGRAILVKSGRLRRSIRIIRTGLGYVQVGTDVPYARIHNEGGIINTTQRVRAFVRNGIVHKNVYNIRTRSAKSVKVNIGRVNVRAHTRRVNIKIDKRQFMGSSTFLNKRILMNTEYKIKRILNR